MRFFYLLFLATIFLSCHSFAQEDNVTTATSSLQSVLSNLKESVTKLGMDNDQLAAKDSFIKTQMLQLQKQLETLESRGGELNNAALQLQGRNPRRSQQMALLINQNLNLDNGISNAGNGIKLAQQSLDTGYQEEQKLLLQLKGLSNVLIEPAKLPSPVSQSAQNIQKEKLKLMKMIYDSQERQESLHEAILDFQKKTPLLPAASAMAQQQLLKDQIKDLENQLAVDPTEKLDLPANQSDDEQMYQLEFELKSLERNYLQLKDLMGRMTQKAQSIKMSVNQKMEEEKLQGKMDDIKRQGQGLRVNLDDLRSQMIDLDKRKTSLEEMVKHLNS